MSRWVLPCTVHCTAGSGARFAADSSALGGQWSRPTADGVELFNIASVRVTRYRYRGVKIPNAWTRLNHA